MILCSWSVLSLELRSLGALLCGLIIAVYLTATHNSATMSYIQRSIDSTATKLGVSAVVGSALLQKLIR